MFLELIEEEMQMIEEDADLFDLIEELYFDNPEQMKEDLDLDDELYNEILENFVRTVTSTGKVTKRRSRAVRRRRESVTKKMSKSRLRQIGRKAARSRKRNPSGMRKALRKRKKAMRRRKALGIKNNR